MKGLILAGGRGTRLWPLSRESFPKQFLKLSGQASLLQETVRRLLHVLGPADLVVVTNADYQFHVQADIAEDLGVDALNRVILEPCMRNTAPALALAAVFCLERLGCTPDEVLFVAPSDHGIRPLERFVAAARRAETLAASGYLVTFGVTPRTAETGYGYIKAGGALQPDVYRVERFTEKPDAATAERYLQAGGYYWNSGMFVFQIAVLFEELRQHAPEIHRLVQLGYDGMLAEFSRMPNISIDYAVMEHSQRAVTLASDFFWSDLGSWDALFDLLRSDADGNVRVGNVLSLDTRNSLVMATRRLVATLGLSDMLVVETDDAVFVGRRGDAVRVEDLVTQLQQAARSEARDHLTVQRPWGHYTVLSRGDRNQIKRIVLNPRQQLSLQMHEHRNEHWVVVRGTALISIDGVERTLHENESAYVPKQTRHRVANPGDMPLEIIEVQNGDYLGEDDVVRFDDIYGRETTASGR